MEFRDPHCCSAARCPYRQILGSQFLVSRLERCSVALFLWRSFSGGRALDLCCSKPYWRATYFWLSGQLCSPPYFWREGIFWRSCFCTGMIRAFGLNEDMQRNYKSMPFVILLAALHLGVLLAAFIAPYDGIEQNREVPFAPQSILHFADSHGHFHARPSVYLWKARGDDLDLYDEDRDRAYPIQLFVPGYEYKVIGLFRTRVHLLGVESPGKIMLFGTDRFGRDIFSRTLLGGQMSLLAGLLATGVTICLGAIIGGASGFYGGWLDRLWMQV